MSQDTLPAVTTVTTVTVDSPGTADPAAAILAFVLRRYPQAELGADDDIFDVGYVNSLFAMELVMFVEQTFAVTVPNAELRIDNFRTATAMADLVARVRPPVPAGDVTR